LFAHQEKRLQIHPSLGMNYSMSLIDQPKAVSALCSLFELVERDLGLPLSRALLTVAQHPGLSVNDLAEFLQVPQQTASRYAATLLGRYESATTISAVSARRPLLTLEVSQSDPRRRALFLTTEGSQLLEKLLSHYLRTHEQQSRISQSGRSSTTDRLDRD
jgi:DNA-binding MarR family transcriptional regulator